MAGLFNGAPPLRPDQPSPQLPPPLPPMPPDDEAMTPSADRQRFAQASGSNAGQPGPGSPGRLQSILGDDRPSLLPPIWKRLTPVSPAPAAGDALDNDVGLSPQLAERNAKILAGSYPSHGQSLTAPKPQTDRVLAGQVDLGSAGPFTERPTIDVAARKGDRFVISAYAPTWVAEIGMPFPHPGSASVEIRGWSVDTRIGKAPPDVYVDNKDFLFRKPAGWHDTEVPVRNLKSDSQVVRFIFSPNVLTPQGAAIRLWKLPPDAK